MLNFKYGYDLDTYASNNGDVLFSLNNNQLHFNIKGVEYTVQSAVNNDINNINSSLPIGSQLIPELQNTYYSLKVLSTDWKLADTYYEATYEIFDEDNIFQDFSAAPIIVPYNGNEAEIKQNFSLIKSISFTKESNDYAQKLIIKLQTFNLIAPNRGLTLLIIGLGKRALELDTQKGE